jgi:hypothetical protein
VGREQPFVVVERRRANQSKNLSIVEPRRKQSYVRLFPMPAPSTSLASLEPFASSATNIDARGRGGRSSRHPKGDMHPWPE